MDLGFLASQIPLLIPAAVTTVVIFVATLVLGSALGMILAIGRVYGPAPIRLSFRAYSWALRAVPALLVLYFAFYGLPSLGLVLPPMTAAILGLSLSTGAYMGETFRSGLLAVAGHQIEAAQALGLDFGHIMTRIILPQAARTILPPWGSNVVLLLKGTTLASVIAVSELTGVAYAQIATTYRPWELLTAVSVTYVVLSLLILAVLSRAERHWALR